MVLGIWKYLDLELSVHQRIFISSIERYLRKKHISYIALILQECGIEYPFEYFI